ncbi:MAG: RagB/SusD family nutrient uptake outer membrane protein [Runella sp.]
MKRYLFSLMTAIGIVVGLLACKEEFLVTKDPNSLTSGNFPTTLAHLDLMLNGVYANRHAFGLYGHNMFGKNTNCFDHTQDQSWVGFQFWNEMNQNNTRPDNEFMTETWRDAWRGVQRANTLLAGLESFRKTNARPADEARLREIEGQTLYLRAWFYYYLAGFWNEDMLLGNTGGDKMGVPIITTVSSTLDQTRVQRATVKQTWDFIIADLRRADELLANKVWTGNDRHRIGTWAVKAFLGKVYTFIQDWPNARTNLEAVINNSGKSLVPFNIYRNMFNGENEYNAESIDEINMNIDRNTWGAWGDRSMGSSVGMVQAPSFMGDNGQPNGSGWSNVFPHDKTLERYGFKEPIINYVDNPRFDRNRPTSIDNLPRIPNPAYIQRSLTIRNQQLADPRLWIGTQQPFVDSMIVGGRKRPITQFTAVPSESFHAWSFGKFVNKVGTEGDVNQNNGSNFYWIRLADVYLLYAEVLIQTGNPTLGLEYINRVKRRAYNLPALTPSPRDYRSLTDATVASDPVLRNSPLRYERWAELYGEGHWWFDVRRWKIGNQEAAYYQNVRGGPIQWADTDYAQPIPQQEMEANPLMKQNPGY